MAFLRKFSFAPLLLRRWYKVLAVVLTAVIWAALALALLPVEDRAGSYATRPYGFMTGMEDSALDILFQLRDARHMELRGRGLAEPITIIEVDEESIKESNVRLQKWPRSWYARLIDRASEGGANTIGLDVYLSEAGGVSAEDKAADTQLAESISNAGNVVLAQKLDAGGTQSIVPLPAFADGAWALGFVDLPHESDRYVRTAQLTRVRTGDDGKVQVQDSFASMITQGFLEQQLVRRDEQTLQLGERVIPLRKDGNVQVDFRGRSPGFRQVSAKDILCEEFKRDSAPGIKCDESAKVSDELFRDRIVLIGATNNDAPDLFTTSFYFPKQLVRPVLQMFDKNLPTVPKLMPGIEVHANIVATLLNGKYLVRPSYTEQLAMLLLPLLLVAVAIFWLRALWGFLVTIVVAAGVLAVASWAFSTHGMILPLASAELGLLGMLAPSGFLLRYAHERAVRDEKEAERAAIMDIFSRCVSPEVADTLWQQREDLSLGGERRIVTLIFTDIRGFTSLSESVDSAVVVQWLNEYFSRMHRIVCSYGGHINKFIGDGLMIVFGAPVARGDKLEARAAVACGLEMLAELERINKEWEGTGRPHLAIGVGIHTGEATCGVVGAEGRLEYTIIGDTVNLAARLESTTKDKSVPILISNTTAELLGVDYETRPLGDVTVKGKSQSTEVFTVKK
ncbi:MAG TPA: adenylate/guanylate cyclase domain-containing protein, partial [Pyrinomonadaceae bacterium]|nr:adenylate/guanylate cyclase domain-containing protein [Pyrinomonadaceae bacterium]